MVNWRDVRRTPSCVDLVPTVEGDLYVLLIYHYVTIYYCIQRLHLRNMLTHFKNLLFVSFKTTNAQFDYWAPKSILGYVILKISTDVDLELWTIIIIVLDVNV